MSGGFYDLKQKASLLLISSLWMIRKRTGWVLQKQVKQQKPQGGGRLLIPQLLLCFQANSRWRLVIVISNYTSMGLAAVFLGLTHAHSHTKTHPDILITPRSFVPNKNREESKSFREAAQSHRFLQIFGSQVSNIKMMARIISENKPLGSSRSAQSCFFGFKLI